MKRFDTHLSEVSDVYPTLLRLLRHSSAPGLWMSCDHALGNMDSNFCDNPVMR